MYQFGAEYFSNLVQAREAEAMAEAEAAAATRSLADMSFDEIQDFILGAPSAPPPAPQPPAGPPPGPRRAPVPAPAGPARGGGAPRAAGGGRGWAMQAL